MSRRLSRDEVPEEVARLFDKFNQHGAQSRQRDRQRPYAWMAVVLGGLIAAGSVVFGNPQIGVFGATVGLVALMGGAVWFISHRQWENRHYQRIWDIEQRANVLGFTFVFVKPGESWIFESDAEKG